MGLNEGNGMARTQPPTDQGDTETEFGEERMPTSITAAPGAMETDYSA